MNCKDLEPIVGCLAKADGTFEPVSIHYTYGTNAAGTEIIESVRYTIADGTIRELVAGESVTPGPCCCPTIKEHYLCLSGVKTPVWVSIQPDTFGINSVVNSLDLSTVDPTEYASGFINPCSSCAITGCIQFNGFDGAFDISSLSVGDVTNYEIYLDTVLNNTLVLDYLSTNDGVNQSSWYTDLVNYINTNTNFTLSVVTDVSVADRGKIVWQLDYDGPGNEELQIVKDGGDTYTFNVDSAGTITTTITDNLGNPFSTPALIQPCA